MRRPPRRRGAPAVLGLAALLAGSAGAAAPRGDATEALGEATAARGDAKAAAGAGVVAQADLLDWAGGLLRGLGGGKQPAEPHAPSAAELARREEVAQIWDAFLTFVVKQAGAEDLDPELRQDLLSALLDGRHDTVSVLTDVTLESLDPLRALFSESWERLAPVLEQVSAALPPESALRYRAFLEGADTLRAMGELGAAAGVELSPDELRRLANLVAPAAERDPLAYDTELDPQLREVFGFGPPLEAAEENAEVDLSSDEPTPAGEPSPAPTSRALPGADLRVAALHAWRGFDPRAWLVREAWAAEAPPRSASEAAAALDPHAALVKRLNSWVPARGEIDSYLPLARDLLNTIGARTLAAKPVAAPYDEVYRLLMLATAWQETCWRQFVRVGGAVRPIRSVSGSVGLMQINQRVWRGFYEIPSLQRDIGYNGRAGSEILRHYLMDYAVKRGEDKATGDIDNLARATYAVYNGGPGHLRRYRQANEPAALRAIDTLFWEKYRAVKAGREMDVVQCYTGKGG